MQSTQSEILRDQVSINGCLTTNEIFFHVENTCDVKPWSERQVAFSQILNDSATCTRTQKCFHTLF